jgi:hypothetical protein
MAPYGSNTDCDSLAREVSSALSLMNTGLARERDLAREWTLRWDRSLRRLAEINDWNRDLIEDYNIEISAPAGSPSVSPLRLLQRLAKLLGLSGARVREPMPGVLALSHTLSARARGWVPSFSLPRGDTLEIDPTGHSPAVLDVLTETALRRRRVSWKDSPGKILIGEWRIGTEIELTLQLSDSDGGLIEGTESTEGHYTGSISLQTSPCVYTVPTGRVREWLELFIVDDSPHTEIPRRRHL